METHSVCVAQHTHQHARAAHQMMLAGGKVKSLNTDKNVESVPQLLMQVYVARNDPIKAQYAALQAYRLISEEPLVVLMAAVATLGAVRYLSGVESRQGTAMYRQPLGMLPIAMRRCSRGWGCCSSTARYGAWSRSRCTTLRVRTRCLVSTSER